MNSITETLTGIVSRVTYHNPDSGWSVLRVQPYNSPQQQETVTVHQTKVFAGVTIEFRGVWTIDHKYGRQFKATEAIEKKLDLNVFNGDIGKIMNIDNEALTCIVSFYPDNREVQYKKEDIMELDLTYAITIHKSQGSEFKAVIIPVLTQHFKMLYRNLIYTGLTRAKELAVFVGTRKALSMAIRQQHTSQRQTALETLIKGSN